MHPFTGSADHARCTQRKTGLSARRKPAASLGLCVLLVLVAIGVAIFISTGSKVKEYEFLEKEPFETAYGVTGMVRSRLAEYKDEYTRLNIIGTVLCILSVVPLFICVCRMSATPCMRLRYV